MLPVRDLNCLNALLLVEIVCFQNLEFLCSICFLSDAVVIFITQQGGVASLAVKCDAQALTHPVVFELAKRSDELTWVKWTFILRF
jgi:hypothetical protein